MVSLILLHRRLGGCIPVTSRLTLQISRPGKSRLNLRGSAVFNRSLPRRFRRRPAGTLRKTVLRGRSTMRAADGKAGKRRHSKHETGKQTDISHQENTSPPRSQMGCMPISYQQEGNASVTAVQVNGRIQCQRTHRIPPSFANKLNKGGAPLLVAPPLYDELAAGYGSVPPMYTLLLCRPCASRTTNTTSLFECRPDTMAR